MVSYDIGLREIGARDRRVSRLRRMFRDWMRLERVADGGFFTNVRVGERKCEEMKCVQELVITADLVRVRRKDTSCFRSVAVAATLHSRPSDLMHVMIG